MLEWCIAAVEGLYSSFSLQQKGCCRGLYTTHALSHGPISIQQLYSSCIGCIAIQLYSSYTVYILYSIPLATWWALPGEGPSPRGGCARR